MQKENAQLIYRLIQSLNLGVIDDKSMIQPQKQEKTQARMPAQELMNIWSIELMMYKCRMAQHKNQDSNEIVTVLTECRIQIMVYKNIIILVVIY